MATRKAKGKAQRRKPTARKTGTLRQTKAVFGRAGREARLAAADVAASAEAKRAMRRARGAVDALARAATATGALIQAAWRTSGGHARRFTTSAEMRALQAGARRAVRNAASAARAAGVAVEQRGEKAWSGAVAGGRKALSQARGTMARARRRLARR
jgi:hypothetical protein